ETHMWQNAATQANVSALRARGVLVIDPETGPLASGDIGPGRLASLERIEAAIDEALGGSQVLAGRSVVVTAGPTREAIEPVGFVSNRSSGKMGYAIAAAARDAGADVILITGPTALVPPAGVRTFPVESADDMKDAVLAQLPRADAVIMAAAVADYRPIERATKKMKKKELGNEMRLRLVENPDLLEAIVAARRPGTIVPLVSGQAGAARHAHPDVARSSRAFVRGRVRTEARKAVKPHGAVTAGRERRGGTRARSARRGIRHLR